MCVCVCVCSFLAFGCQDCYTREFVCVCACVRACVRACIHFCLLVLKIATLESDVKDWTRKLQVGNGVQKYSVANSVFKTHFDGCSDTGKE